MKKILYVLPMALMLFASCATTKSAYSLAGEWNVVNLNGQTITPSESTPYIGFDINEERLYGFTGCNRLTGNLKTSQFMKGKADFGHLATTRMLCQDDKYEQPFLDALNKVKQSEMTENEILLKDGNGKVLITLKKK